jgi:hypothetical protein
MRKFLAVGLAVAALAASARLARAGAPPPPKAASATELPAGRYSVPLKGLLCAVCTRAIAAEWAKLPAVEKVEADYDSGKAVVTVRLGKTLPVSALRRALRRAERTANLGAQYDIGDIAYLP